MFRKRLSDKSLLALLKSEEEASYQKGLNYIYKHSHNKIRKIIMAGFSFNIDKATDILHDSLLTFLANVRKDQFKGEGSLENYLIGIAKRKSLDQRKKEEKRNKLERIEIINPFTVDQNNPERILIKKELKEKILWLVDQLPKEKCRAILRLRMDGLSFKEIAEKLKYKNAEVAQVTRFNCFRELQEIAKKHNFIKVLKFN